MSCKKQGAKNRVIAIQLEKRQPGPFLKVPDPKKISGRPDKLE